MNKNKIAGIVLIVAAVMLVAVCALTQGGVVVRCIGKAVWFLPYATLVAGIGRFIRA